MCADTITANFHWVKPEISGSPTTWGVKLNADLDLIDSQLFTTMTQSDGFVGDAVVGEIKMFAGATAPAKYKLCDGTVYNNTDIPLLAPVLNNIYGGVPGLSNAVPDLRQKFPVGAGTIGSSTLALGATGGEATHTLVTAEMPSHNHPLTDPGHFHTLTDEYVFGADFFMEGTGPAFLTDTSSDTTTSTTGITIAATGGDGAHNNMPPYCGVNFIIKFQ